LPGFIPVNYFWANVGKNETNIPVIDQKTGKPFFVTTANFMKDLIIKKSVRSPRAYLIPQQYQSLFKPLLKRHKIGFKELKEEMEMTVEICRLLRIEEFSDPVYQRYSGRQIVERGKPSTIIARSGDIFIPLDQTWAIRAALLLEPNMLYGIYGYKEYQTAIKGNKEIPVFRVMEYLP
jgi:hypothetical protein